MNIVIIAGGTGGHIFPARSTALALSKKGHKVVIFGDKNYRKYHQSADLFGYKIISASQAEKKISTLFKMGFKISWGIIQSLFLLCRYRPQKVLAFGGYATFPGLIAAIILRKTIILHEQNAHLGKVNRIFAKYARIIALSYPETAGIEAQYVTKTKFTGNPIREEIIGLSKIEYQLPDFNEKPPENKNTLGYNVLLASEFRHPPRKKAMFNILVIGGSGGAKIFSDILPKAFFNIREELKNHLSIAQQCRRDDLSQLAGQYESFNLNVNIRTFFEDMSEQIKKAHLIIARAGASSIAEFTAAKKPLILVPFASSSDNHQEKNAQFVEKMGGALLIRETDFTITKVTYELEKLIDNSALLHRMSRLSFICATLEATDNLVKLIENL